MNTCQITRNNEAMDGSRKHKNQIRVAFAAVALLLVVAGVHAMGVGNLALRIENGRSGLVAVLKNVGSGNERVSEAYAVSGLGGGNLLPIIVTDVGQLIPPCEPFDSFVNFRKEAVLGPGKQLSIRVGDARSLARLHCLEEGSYSLSFSYLAPGGQLLFANSMQLEVDSSGKAEIKPL